jgi:hypothetical protein
MNLLQQNVIPVKTGIHRRTNNSGMDSGSSPE